MSKSLIIAEKPSVAIDISKALGGFKKVTDGNESYFESDDYVLSSAVGHLVELCLPGELDKKKGKWSFANLPVIPDEFALKPIERSEGRLRLLKKLMKRADVTNLINACDAGREGELIFRYIVKLAACKKPIQRLWLQSMTPASIRDGFAHLAPRFRARTAGQRGGVPLGKRLARRHQRHARADGVQFAQRRFSTHAGRPRADADPRHRGRARPED